MNRGREDRDELAGAVAGSDRAMGPLGPGQRWTAARKREVVLRLCKGVSNYCHWELSCSGTA
jgi:hypothetical protein